VEAVLADASTKIEAVVPKEVVTLWQTRSRALLANIPTGTLFRIRKSELRVSDCFLPPRIELWINSFRIVGSLGTELPSDISETGASPTLRHLLQIYTTLHERKTLTTEDTVRMSSPLHSQASVLSSNGSCHEIDAENSETKTSSQPFHTQISHPPSPKHRRQPFTPRQPRISPDHMSDNRVSLADTSSLLPISNNAQATVSGVEALTTSVERTSEQVRAKLQREETVREPALSHAGRSDPSENARTHQESIIVNDDHWPGGRPPLSKGRYLPRRLMKISKEQQEILQTANAWQPSKGDRQIRGSIPNQILESFTALADKGPKGETEGSFNSEESRDTKESVTRTQLDEGIDKVPEDVSSDESNSQVSICPSWSPTPRSPALAQPALPDNSSPLRAPLPQVSRSLSRNDSPVAILGDASHQGRNAEAGLAVHSPRWKTVCAIKQALESADAAPDSSDSVGSEAKTVYPGPMLSPEVSLSPHRGQGELEKVEPSGTLQRQSNINKCPTPRNPVAVASSTQGCLNRPNVDDKVLVQVQRTPFVHQPPRSIQGLGICGRATGFPVSSTGASAPNDQELKSSTSVVPGTFRVAQIDQRRHSEGDATKLLHDVSDSSESERMEEDGHCDFLDVSNAADAVDAGLEAHSWTRSGSASGLDQSLDQHCGKKRKRCSNDHITPRVEGHQSTKSHQTRSSPTPSKRARTTSVFPSLGALKDIAPVRASSVIARESRRKFFRNPQSGTWGPTTTQGEPDLVREVPQSTQQCRTTPRIGLLSRTSSRREGGIDTSSRLSPKDNNIYETYKASYPEYQGDTEQFYKACKQIQTLRRDGRAPHPSLWDDFIFRRHHEYRDYLLEVTEACEDAMPYLQYYTERVENPSRMQLVVRPSYISSLGADSATGSSVMSPAVEGHNQMEATKNVKESVAASSSASNILPAPQTTRLAVARHHQQRPDLTQGLASHEQDGKRRGQDSSVEQWVELQCIEKELGAESPELGSTDVAPEVADVPRQVLDDSVGIAGNSSPHREPAATAQQEKEPLWCDDPDTPFKSFARRYTSLASESSRLKRRVKVDGKGCLEPQLQNVIDMFTYYRK